MIRRRVYHFEYLANGEHILEEDVEHSNGDTILKNADLAYSNNGVVFLE